MVVELSTWMIGCQGLDVKDAKAKMEFSVETRRLLRGPLSTARAAVVREALMLLPCHGAFILNLARCFHWSLEGCSCT